MSRIEGSAQHLRHKPGHAPEGSSPVGEHIADRILYTNRALTAVATSIMEEMLAFGRRRMTAQLDFIGSVPRCQDMATLVSAQLRYVEQASRDYTDELATMAEVVRHAAQHNGAELRPAEDAKAASDRG
jgi:hypothetical protein